MVMSMGASRIIKQLMIERDMTVKDLSEKLGIAAQSASNKLYRDTFSYNEIVKIADILGCDVVFVTRDTSKEFIQK